MGIIYTQITLKNAADVSIEAKIRRIGAKNAVLPEQKCAQNFLNKRQFGAETVPSLCFS
ncbi:hypothetical protein FACS1894137_16540 [Spirochaetia bacterium]|nr:hypothetical protein FACS1894137_16540 [Spirochaetia bacterium]